MHVLEATVAAIREVDSDAAAQAARWQLSLTKPPGSLGRLEHIAERVCAAQRTVTPSVANAAVAVFAGDHGVAREGVSAYPSTVTAQMVANFAAGGAAICELARSAGAALVVVDVGVGDAGARNFAREPAMSRDEARRASEVGIETANGLDVDVLGVGEMGIGNTTSAAALASVFCDVPALLTGRGTGVDDEQLALEVTVSEMATFESARVENRA